METVVSDSDKSYGGSDEGVLKRFMQEFFPYSEFKKFGFFTKEMKGDYYAQAKKACMYFGYKSIFEYGLEEVSCHISYVNTDKSMPFITTIPSIYE